MRLRCTELRVGVVLGDQMRDALYAEVLTLNHFRGRDRQWELCEAIQEGTGRPCRQRHLNQKLADLRDNGDVGNGRDEAQGDGRAGRVDAYERRYCRGPVKASLAIRRGEQDEVYWRQRTGRWYVLGM
jgi:hypothetical protein